jgi:hypothetical protein
MAVIGPLLGTDGKPLLDDYERDPEGMTLIIGLPQRHGCRLFGESHRQ